MRSVLGAVAALFALALLQPWNLRLSGEVEVVTPRPVPRMGPAAELEQARRCIRPAVRRARPVCMRIHERRGGVETRLGKAGESARR